MGRTQTREAVHILLNDIANHSKAFQAIQAKLAESFMKKIPNPIGDLQGEFEDAYQKVLYLSHQKEIEGYSKRALTDLASTVDGGLPRIFTEEGRTGKCEISVIGGDEFDVGSLEVKVYEVNPTEENIYHPVFPLV